MLTMFKQINPHIIIILCNLIALQCKAERENLISEKTNGILANADNLLFLRTSRSFEPEILWMAKEVESRPSDNPEETLQFLTDRLRQVRELSKTPDFKPSPDQQGFMMNHLHGLIDVLQEFSMLPKADKPIHCSIHSMEHFLSSLDILYGGLANFARLLADDYSKPENFLKLYTFMKTYAIQHIQGCLVSLTNPNQLDLDYIKGRETANGEWRLDQMLSAWKVAPNEEELLVRARDLDLRRGRFDDARLISSLRRSANDLDVEKTLHIGVFAQDIEDSCAEFPVKVVNLVTNYQLAKVLIPNEIEKLRVTPRFLKINEYFRMCNQLTNPEIRDETLRNLQSNFKFLG